MHLRTSRNSSRRSPASRTPSPHELAARAGRPQPAPGQCALDHLEPRVLLAVDHPSLPAAGTATPWPSTALTVDLARAQDDPLLGRASATGTISSGDPGDLFRFTMPTVLQGGKARDFVTVLADTGPSTETNKLDSFVEVYDSTGTLITSGANNAGASVGVTTDPTRARTPDGWAGFEGVAGQTYYIRVRADSTIGGGRAAVGTYTLRVDSISLVINPDTASPNAAVFGTGRETNSITLTQEDIVYRFETGSSSAFNSVASFQAVSLDTTNPLLNPRLDVYTAGNSAGVVTPLIGDSDSGRQTDAFAVYPITASTVYYIRVRGDDYRASTDVRPGDPPRQSVGAVTTFIRAAATTITVDPVTRLGNTEQPFEVVGPDLNNGAPQDGTGLRLFRFTAQGTGEGYITAIGGPLVDGDGLERPSIRLYDATGRSIDFARASGNNTALIVTPVVGGQTYYVVVEGFDSEVGDGNSRDGNARLFIEAHHTFNPTPGETADDHANTPTVNALREWENATPLRFQDPERVSEIWNPDDANGAAPVGTERNDHSFIQRSNAVGRINRPGDSDLFQFTPPLSQLSNYGGNTTINSPALYVGGNFANAGRDPVTGQPVKRNNTAIWDIGEWFDTGPRDMTTAGGTLLDGPLDGPVYAQTVWDPDGTVNNFQPTLVAVGNFTNVWAPVDVTGGGDIAWQVTPANVAFRVLYPPANRYIWATTIGFRQLEGTNPPRFTTVTDPINFINAPILAAATFDAAPNLPGQTGASADELIIGGDFDLPDGDPNTPGNQRARGLLRIQFRPNPALQDRGTLAFDVMGGGVIRTGGQSGIVRALTVYDPPAPATPTNPAPMMPVTPAYGDQPAGLYIGGLFDTADQIEATPAITGGATITANNIVRYGRRVTEQTAPVMFIPVAHLAGELMGPMMGVNNDPGPLPAGANNGVTATSPGGNALLGGVYTLAVVDVAGTERDDAGTTYGQPMAAAMQRDVPARLYIGGAFSRGVIFGAAATNLVSYDGLFRTVGNGTPPPNLQNIVRSIVGWRETVDNTTTGSDTQLVIAADAGPVPTGQQFANTGTIRIWRGQNQQPMAWANIGDTAGGTVLTLAVVEEGEPATNAPWEQLYIGGTFTQITEGPVTLTNTSRIARRAAFDPGNRQWTPAWTPLFSPPDVTPPNTPLGVNGLSDPPPASETTTAVYSLRPFTDVAGNAFRRQSRQGSRVAITVNRAPEAEQLTDLQVRVFDSNFALLYTNDTIAAPQADPAGALNPGFLNAPAANTQLVLPETWAGEVYYVEVTAGGNGRYDLEVITEALPPEEPTANPQDGVYIDTFSTINKPVGIGQWADAPIIETDGNGFARNYYRSAGFPGPHGPGRPPNPLNPNAPFDANFPDAYTTRFYAPDAEGNVRYQFDDTAYLSRPDEVHLFQFRAENDGTAEIRLATKGILAAWQEQLINERSAQRTQVNSLIRQKVINSPLHGAVRVFTNDRSTGQFVQTGFSDGNLANQGQIQQLPHHEVLVNTAPGDATDRFFTHRDPRLVLNVERGNTYFIQVESAYRGTFLTDEDLVDWRFATGRYELLVKSTPSFLGIDDHPNLVGPPNNLLPDRFNDTPIVVSPRTGAGSISGEIRNVTTGPIQNVIDTDVFRYVADNRGQVRITLNPTGPGLIPRIEVFGLDLARVATNTAAGPGSPISVTFNAEQGETFFIGASGINNTQGTYQIAVQAVGITDDQPFSTATDTDNAAPLAGWANVTGLTLNRFLGTYGVSNPSTGAVTDVSGLIENPDDRDIFRFTAEAFEQAIVTVTATDPSLDPLVEIFEVNLDGNGNEVFQLIARNNDGQGQGENARTSFSTTPGRSYYVVVSGASLATDFGRYGLTINVAPTDDHPNRTDFPSGTLITLNFDAINFVSTGSTTGRLERAADDDLFRFVAPADGTATITFARAVGSTLAGSLTIVDQTGADFGPSRVTYTTGAGGSITAVLNGVLANTQYYIRVRAGTPGAGETDTGNYSVAVRTDPVDDHANAGQFAQATTITLSSNSGVGNGAGVLVPTGDSDLFRFTALLTGTATVRVSTPGSNLQPRVALFNAATQQLVALDGNGDSATAVINVGASQLFYILVTAVGTPSGPASAVGTYSVSVTNVAAGGGGGGGGGADDFPNAGEWNDAAVIALDSQTGRGSVNGNVNFAGDTDLFRFTALNSGTVDILMSIPTGGLVDGTLELYAANQTLILSDSQGIAGSTAAIRFTATANESYFLLMRPSGPATGSYAIRLAATPLESVAYFPEGFRGPSVNEYVILSNPNATAVTWALYARYEVGDNPDVPIATGTINPGQRAGTAITERTNPAGSRVRDGAYALELRSSLPLGASFSHFDFDAGLGESFTQDTSTVWSFAEVHKDRVNFRDFLLFYNPSTQPADLTIEAFYTDGTTASFTARVESRRRGGINIDTESRLPKEGLFGVRVTSTQPIVSAQSSYNLTRSGGDALLGDPNGGSTRGALPGVRSQDGVVSNFSILNTNDVPATVSFVASYARVDQPPILRSFTIPARSTFTQSFQTLGLLAGQNAGVRYTSDLPVTLSVFEYQNGDANATTTATTAARGFNFADLFLQPSQAGINYIQRLSLFNPTNQTIEITPTYIFTNTTSATGPTIRIEANSFAFVQLDRDPLILSAPQIQGGVQYSVRLDAAQPFVANFLSYNLLLAGGFSALGQPIGLTTPLTAIG